MRTTIITLISTLERLSKYRQKKFLVPCALARDNWWACENSCLPAQKCAGNVRGWIRGKLPGNLSGMMIFRQRESWVLTYSRWRSMAATLCIVCSKSFLLAGRACFSHSLIIWWWILGHDFSCVQERSQWFCFCFFSSWCWFPPTCICITSYNITRNPVNLRD